MADMSAHKSRFKAYLIEPSKWSDEAVDLRAALGEIQALWRSGQLSAPEVVFLFISVYLQKRAPNRWWMSRGRSVDAGAAENGFSFSRLSDNFSELKKLKIRNFAQFCEVYQLKRLPLSVLRSLAEWESGRYRLHLLENTITPLEMLEYQARGERVVTLAWDKALAGMSPDGKRDAFDFLLHDLVHADLFYSENHEGQLLFFKGVARLFAERVWENDLAMNGEFRQDIDYLISDMNADIHHLRQSLRACLIKHHLFLEHRGPRDVLSAHGQVTLDRHVEKVREIAGTAVLSP